MLVYVDTMFGSTFPTELNPSDRVLDIKKTIEKSVGIPVSVQALYYNNVALLDDLDLRTYNIVDHCRLLLYLTAQDNNQVLQQTEQSPVPPNSIKDLTNVEDSLGKNQDWSGMARSSDDQMLHQTEQSLVPSNETEAFDNQDWTAMVRGHDDQELHQTLKSILPSFSIDQHLETFQEQPLTSQDISKVQDFWPGTTEENANIQESSWGYENNQDLLQSEPTSTLTTLGEDRRLSTESFTNIQSYLPASTTEEIINMNQTEQSRVPSNSFGDFSSGGDRRLSTESFNNIPSYLPASTTEEIINMNQTFQMEQSTVPSNSFGDFSSGEDRSLSNEHLTSSQSYLLANTAEEIINMNPVFQPEQSTVPSNSFEDFSVGEDRRLSTGSVTNVQSYLPASTTEEIINKNQMFQTEQSTVPSNTFGDFSSGQDRFLSTAQLTCSQSYLPTNTAEEIFNMNQMFQKDQSTVPSNSFGDFSVGEDRRLSTESFTNIPSYLPASTAEEIINMNQTFQMDQSTVPSNSFGDLSSGQDRFLSTEHFTSNQGYWPANTNEQIINNNQLFQTEHSPVPSNSTEQRTDTQDLPVRVESSNQVVKSPPIREVINIRDSPVKVGRFKKPPQKLRVMMLPYSRENEPVSMFPVSVTASEKVEELRKELEKIQQKAQLNLPKEGYFFIHNQRVLDDDQSFRWNGVAHGDTIEIFPGYVTKG